MHVPRGVPDAVTRALADLRPSQVAKGIPLHVTLLYPWVPRDDVQEADQERVRALFAAREPFAYSLTRVDGLPAGYAYLVPEPPDELRDCTRALCELFPAYPPYGGAHGGGTIPHATLAFGVPPELVEERVRNALPFSCEVDDVALLEEHEPDRWRVRERFPLGGGAPS